MIITKQKDLKDILKYLEGEKSVFIVGCGECSTTCRTGGEDEVRAMAASLESAGKTVAGSCVPKAPCIAAKLKLELAGHRKAIESADSILVLTCGLGIQSFAENLRLPKRVHVGCDTLFMGEVDAKGDFFERCSACGDCVLEMTGMMCPVTRCPKGLLNGPCGGQDKGKCEVDREDDCVWTLIYNELKRTGRSGQLRQILPPKDYSKSSKPRNRKLR